MRRAPALIAALALVSTAAQAARPACLPSDDMRTLLRIALPDAIEGLAAHCRASLPPDAFLPTEGARLAERYRREAPADPARARHAIEAATGQNLSGYADDATITTLAHDFIENAIQERVPPRDCDKIDGLVALASPLPADTMTDTLLLALEVAGRDAIRGLAICGPSAESAAP